MRHDFTEKGSEFYAKVRTVGNGKLRNSFPWESWLASVSTISQ
jgi:hypothetical protein